jgi:hypothetical protein|tara:strand:- start:488 stop:745 length:258 start_codon:yes stop_codon:yes gene_type:complete
MTEQETVVETTETEAPQLSLQDIQAMVQIIDICSKRGGFEGQELEAVGSLRNRTVAFLEAAAPKTEGTEGDEAPEAVADEASTEA